MDLTDSFLDYLLYERNYSLETIKSYREDMLQFEAFLAGESGAGKSLALGVEDLGPDYLAMTGCKFIVTALLRDGQEERTAKNYVSF